MLSIWWRVSFKMLSAFRRLFFFYFQKTHSNYFLFGSGIDLLLPLFAWIIEYFIQCGNVRKGFNNLLHLNMYLCVTHSLFFYPILFNIAIFFPHFVSVFLYIFFFSLHVPPKSFRGIEFYFHRRYFTLHCVIRWRVFFSVKFIFCSLLSSLWICVADRTNWCFSALFL